MTFVDVAYIPGTNKSPQRTKLAGLNFTDTNKVHFPDGRLTTLPPFSVAGATSDYVTLIGAVRSIHAHKFSGQNNNAHYLLGGSHRLYSISQGVLYNITPFADQKSESLGNNPLETASSDATLTITWTDHGLAVGDLIALTDAADIGGVDADTYINVEHLVDTVPDGDTITVEMGTNASSTVASGGGANVIARGMEAAATLGTDPISVTDTLNDVTITYTAHGLAVGDRIKLFGVSGAVGGVPVAELNAEHIVATVPDADSFTIDASTAATSTTAGGGSDIAIFKQIPAGNIDQKDATGYGLGEYGEGIYGVGGPAVSAQEFPRIYSFGDFGDNVILCPGDYITGDGQKIYLWDGDTTKAPTIVPNAPTDTNWIDVINNHIVALRGNSIGISAIGDQTDWSGLSSYRQEVQRAWKLVSTMTLNEKEAVIFTTDFALRIRFVGGQDIWDISDLYEDDGIIAPNAACSLDGRVYWRGVKGSYVHDGSIPTRIKNTQNDEWIFDNIEAGKAWKSFCFSDNERSEWYFYFPTDGSDEPSDYLIHNVIGMEGLPNGSFTLGLMDRTAGQKPNVVDGRFYMVNAFQESTAGTPYLHFINDGAVTFDWSATTSEAYLFQGEARGMIDTIFPDSTQSGAATFTMRTREYPQGTLYNANAVTITGSTPYTTVYAAGKIVGMTFSGSSQFTIGAWKMNVRKLGRGRG